MLTLFLEPEFDEDYDFCTHRSSKARHYFDFFRLRCQFYYKYEETTSAFTPTTSKSSRCFTYLQHTYSTELCAKISKSIPLIVAHMLEKRSFVLKRCVLLSKIALFEYLFDSVRYSIWDFCTRHIKICPLGIAEGAGRFREDSFFSRCFYDYFNIVPVGHF